MSRFSRDDNRYWTDRPADHNPAGLYDDGPQMASPGWLRFLVASRLLHALNAALLAQQEAEARREYRQSLPVYKLLGAINGERRRVRPKKAKAA